MPITSQTFSFEYTLHRDEKQFPQEFQFLIQQAKHITQKAYAHYNQFKVGPAVLLDNATIVTGNNQEEQMDVLLTSQSGSVIHIKGIQS
jgi:hypothetical protein